MRVAARLLWVPVVVAAVATAATWAGAATGKPTKPAAPVGVQVSPRRHVGPAPKRTIAGTWNIANGIFVFHRTGDTYTDVVISQRPGVFCPKVNDQNGQIVLHYQGGGVYTGTWKWYYVGTCKFAGFGRLTVTLYWTGNHGIFVANPPSGLPGGSSHTFLIQRFWPTHAAA